MQRSLASRLLVPLWMAVFIFVVSILLGAGIGVLAAPNMTLPDIRNTFGGIQKQTSGNPPAPRVTGAHAYLTTPTVAVAIGSNSQNLVGATWYYTNFFAEVGAMKKCTVFGCQHYPYMASWGGSGHTETLTERTDIVLSPGGWYEYRVFQDHDTIWQGHWCGGAGCVVLANQDVFLNLAMFYADSGAEGYLNSFGPASTSINQWRNKMSTWQDYCWNVILQNVSGSVTTCNSTDHSWTVPNF